MRLLYELDDEKKLFRKTVRDFSEQEIRPQVEHLWETGEFPYDIVRKMGELGILGIPFPEEYGGAGGDYLAYAIAVEELARVDGSCAITVEAHISLGTSPFYYYGSEEQKREWLVPLAQGRILGSFGLTEPEAGSDAGNTQTRAELAGGEWVINGTKCFITNPGTEMSGVVTLTVVTDTRPDGKKEISNIYVPKGTPGYNIAPKYKKMGWHASDTRELSFDDCRVPESNLIGKRGKASNSSSTAWTEAASPSPRWRWGRRRGRSRRASVMPGNASSSAGPSRLSRPYSSSWPTWPPRSR